MHTNLMTFPFSSELRNVYLRTFKRQYWQEHVWSRRQFYARFIKRGSLVFDIGANIGEYSRCFLSLGARVVAVEPLPSTVEILQKTLRPKNRVHIVSAAVGADFSNAVLHVSSETTLCTLSDQWLGTAKQSGRFSDVDWSSDINVPVIPIHSLASEYGQPDFIKIDVEGFEGQVLDGLRDFPPALSFEFNTETPDAVIACLHKPCFSAASKFAFHFGEPKNDNLSRWMTRHEMMAEIPRVCRTPRTFGDILALRR